MKITATFERLGNRYDVVYTRPFTTLDQFVEDVQMFSVGYIDQRKTRKGLQVSLLEQTQEIILSSGGNRYGKATYTITE